MAGPADRLGGPGPPGAGQDDLGGDLGIGSPRGMHRDRPDSPAGAKPVADEFAREDQGGGRAALVGWPVPFGDQGALGHPDGGHVENRPEVHREARPAGVISPGSIYQKDGGNIWKCPDRRFEEEALAEGEETGLVRIPSPSLDEGPSDGASLAEESSGRPCGLAAGIRSQGFLAEADETRGHQLVAGGSPRGRGRKCQPALEVEEVIEGTGPAHAAEVNTDRLRSVGRATANCQSREASDLRGFAVLTARGHATTVCD